MYTIKGRIYSSCWMILYAFLPAADFLQNEHFRKNYFRNTIGVSNGVCPDQANILSGMVWIQTVCSKELNW